MVLSHMPDYNITAYPNLALPVYPKYYSTVRAGAHNLLKYRKVTRLGFEPRTFWIYPCMTYVNLVTA
jgi:hypothetical protein